jgi:hypothetical protein
MHGGALDVRRQHPGPPHAAQIRDAGYQAQRRDLGLGPAQRRLAKLNEQMFGATEQDLHEAQNYQ